MSTFPNAPLLPAGVEPPDDTVAAFDLATSSWVARPRITNAPPQSLALIGPGATTSQTATVNVTGAYTYIVVVLIVTAVSGGSVQVSLSAITPNGSYPLLVGNAVTGLTVGTPLRVGPGLTPSANAVANDVLPSEVEVVATASGTITYTVDYVLGVGMPA